MNILALRATVAGERFDFSNGNITAIATSDVPEPSALTLFGTALVAFGFLLRRREAV